MSISKVKYGKVRILSKEFEVKMTFRENLIKHSLKKKNCKNLWHAIE